MYYAIHGKTPLNNLYETKAAAQLAIEQMKKLPSSPRGSLHPAEKLKSEKRRHSLMGCRRFLLSAIRSSPLASDWHEIGKEISSSQKAPTIQAHFNYGVPRAP